MLVLLERKYKRQESVILLTGIIVHDLVSPNRDLCVCAECIAIIGCLTLVSLVFYISL